MFSIGEAIERDPYTYEPKKAKLLCKLSVGNGKKGLKPI